LFIVLGFIGLAILMAIHTDKQITKGE